MGPRCFSQCLGRWPHQTSHPELTVIVTSAPGAVWGPHGGKWSGALACLRSQRGPFQQGALPEVWVEEGRALFTEGRWCRGPGAGGCS